MVTVENCNQNSTVIFPPKLQWETHLFSKKSNPVWIGVIYIIFFHSASHLFLTFIEYQAYLKLTLILLCKTSILATDYRDSISSTTVHEIA